MYIFKNAFKNISRNKGRNILIGIIIVVIAAASSVTLAIRNSASKIVEAYNEKYDVEATIGVNRENMMQEIKGDDNSQEEMIDAFNDISNLTLDEINSYGDSEYVKNYYYYYEISMDSDDLTEATDSLVKETTTTNTNTQTFTMPPQGNGGPGGGSSSSGYQKQTTTTSTKTEKIYNEKAANGAFTVMGYSSLESMTDFIDGSKTVTDGSIFTDFSGDTKECIISSELAELNDLSVGDTITLVDPSDDDNTVELTITGIYEESSDTSNDMKSMFTNSANTIITSSSVVEEVLSNDEDMSTTITPTYILTSSDVVDSFKEEVSEKGLASYYQVTDNLETVESATKSIGNVKSFATTFLIITLVIGGVVLFVINMINIRERKYEIGVLRTIGMSKFKVISQFIVEIVIIALASLLIGAGIGASCSVKVANNLLSSEIENANSDKENITQNFSGNHGNGSDSSSDSSESDDSSSTPSKPNMDFNNVNGVVSIEQVDDINAVVDIVVLLELLGIGLFLTLVSGISSCVAIARFQPLTILKERS